MDDMRVVWRRNACGAVESVEIWFENACDQVGGCLLDTAAGDNPAAQLESVLRLAREYYRADPHSDALPPDHAVIEAYLDHVA